jgi:hypothetical protein
MWLFGTFKLNFDVDIEEIFWLGNCFGYFSNFFGNFFGYFSIFLATLLATFQNVG